VLIAFDRMEKGRGELSAVQELARDYGLPVIAIATLDDLMRFIAAEPALSPRLVEVEAYRAAYGAAGGHG
jgi:orotate phosphoribosyltransferase